MEEFVGNLEGNEGLAGSRCHCQEDAVLSGCYGIQDLVDGNLLVIPGNLLPVIVERLGVELVPPFIRIAEGPCPYLFRGKVVIHLTFLSGLHIYLVDGIAVGSVSEADFQFLGIFLRLHHAFTHRLLIALRFHDSQFDTLVLEDVIRLHRSGLDSLAYPSPGDGDFREDITVSRSAPAVLFQLGVNLN